MSENKYEIPSKYSSLLFGVLCRNRKLNFTVFVHWTSVYTKKESQLFSIWWFKNKMGSFFIFFFLPFKSMEQQQQQQQQNTDWRDFFFLFLIKPQKTLSIIVLQLYFAVKNVHFFLDFLKKSNKIFIK